MTFEPRKRPIFAKKTTADVVPPPVLTCMNAGVASNRFPRLIRISEVVTIDNIGKIYSKWILHTKLVLCRNLNRSSL
jgi:hypothetical protein